MPAVVVEAITELEAQIKSFRQWQARQVIYSHISQIAGGFQTRDA